MVKIPKRICKRYPNGVRGFRKQKRRELHELNRVIDQLQQGCFFYPCGSGPIYALKNQAEILIESLSVKNWGK